MHVNFLGAPVFAVYKCSPHHFTRFNSQLLKIDMYRLNLRDRNFRNDLSSCKYNNSQRIEWVRSPDSVSNSCFFTDLCLLEAGESRARRRVAWLLEPEGINPKTYEWIDRNNRLFDYVLTYDTRLIARGENFLYYPFGGCWINPHDAELFSNNEAALQCKTMFCSTIVSHKRMTKNHHFRHRICEIIQNVDIFGRGYKYIPNKIDGLRQYKFSITVENCHHPGWWTEKVIDCFATKTIPIYYGDRSVLEHFDPNGIVFIENESEMFGKLEFLHLNQAEEYARRMDALHHNFSLVDDYRVAEDWIAGHYPFLMN